MLHPECSPFYFDSPRYSTFLLTTPSSSNPLETKESTPSASQQEYNRCL